MFRDEYFILALKNTLKLMAVVPIITIAIALVLAFIISQSDLKERGLYRTVFYFPNIISLTVVRNYLVICFSSDHGYFK